MAGGGCGRLWPILSTILIVKAAAGRGKGFWVGEGYQKGIFSIWQVCPMIICCPQFPLQLWPPANSASIIHIYYMWHSTTATMQYGGIGANCDDLRTNVDWKRYFCFINVIKCFVKCNVSIKCNVKGKQFLYSQK